MKVLIVDDSAEVVASLRSLLAEAQGVEIVGTAGDVPAAVAAIQELKPQIVILDIQMPGGSGFDVLKMAKEQQPAPVVTMFTSFSDPQFKEYARKAGADHFVDKSKDFEKVVEICRSLSAGLRADLP